MLCYAMLCYVHEPFLRRGVFCVVGFHVVKLHPGEDAAPLRQRTALCLRGRAGFAATSDAPKLRRCAAPTLHVAGSICEFLESLSKFALLFRKLL
mgnify:CR=1 FL=1